MVDSRDGMGSAPPEAVAGSLRLAVLRLSRRLRQQAVGDVTPSQLSALTSIQLHGELSLGELAAIERIAPPSMTRIANRLEEAGLVHRRIDDSDRRVSRLALSPEGREILDETRHRRDAYLALRLGTLGDDERELLARAAPLLERLASEPGVRPPERGVRAEPGAGAQTTPRG